MQGLTWVNTSEWGRATITNEPIDLPQPAGPLRLTRTRTRYAIALAAVSVLAVAGLPAAAAETPSLVRDIWVGSGSSGPAALTDIAGKAFFTAEDGVNGREVWASDGTEAGTVLARDINLGGATSEVTGFTELGGIAIFAANDGTSGKELWRSDGTPAGTVRVKDIWPNSPGSEPAGFVEFGGSLFFLANDGDLGRELWRTDGTEPATALVKDVNEGMSGSAPVPWAALNNELLFDANDGDHGEELWKTDGTKDGTVLLKDIWTTGSSDPHVMTKVGGLIFFTANDGVHAIELWKTDGTEAGTQLVKDINTNPNEGSFPSGVVRGFADVRGTLFFKANDGQNGVELWKSDGTEVGTTLVKNINDAGDSTPQNLTDVEGTLFFTAQDGSHGTELWKSDGTPEGTTLVEDIRGGIRSSAPAFLTNVNGTLYFSADDGASGRELWRSDGTEAGTVPVADINQGTPSAGVTELSKVDARLFFQANDGQLGAELWMLSVAPPPSICSRTGDVLMINAPSGSSLTIGRSGANFDVTGGGNPDPTCGGSTVFNINEVIVHGTSGNETITIDTQNGNFEPGLTVEPSGISEVEFAIDLGSGTDALLFRLGSANDKWTAGAAGINPNADADSDITLAGIENLTAKGGLGTDQLSAGGKNGTAGPYPLPVTLQGESGKDTLTGGLGNDSADGGDGNDTFKALNTADGADDFVGGSGSDAANYGQRKPGAGGVTVDPDNNPDDGKRPAGEGDNIHSDVENVVGSKGDDTIDDGGLVLKNAFKGGDGNDNVNAIDGVNNGDTVDGGAGANDVCFADAGESITNCP